jgi:hypothetical protein
MASKKPESRSKRLASTAGESSRPSPLKRGARRPARARTEPPPTDIPEPDPIERPPTAQSTDRETPRRGIRADISRNSLNAATDAAMRASRRAIGVTPIIVQKAASILEEEVALGIGAAKRIEQRFLDVAALRAQPADAVMSRFRCDAHEAVDIILDIVTAAATTLGDRAGRFINVTAGHATSTTSSRQPSAPEESGMRLATVRIKGKVKPGGVGELTMSLENESDQTTAEFTLHAAELVSASGARIPSDHVSFVPATLSVGPRSSGQVGVKVKIPVKAPPGVYEGLIRATQLDALRALLSIEVG